MVKTTPQRFTPGNDPPLIVQETGWAPEVVCMSAANLAPTGFDPRTLQRVAIPTMNIS